MKIPINITFIFLALSVFAKERPEDLIETHFRLIGGKTRLEKLMSVKRKGAIEFPDHGQIQPKGSGSYETCIIYPDRVRIQIQVGSYRLDRIRNRDKYWSLEKDSFNLVTDEEVKIELNDTSLKANRELLWWENEHQNVHKIDSPKSITHSNCIAGVKSNSKDFICFDKTTGLLKAYGNDIEYRLYKDWRNTGSIKMPFRIEQYKNTLLSYSIQLYSVEVDTKLSDSEFNP